MSLIIGKRIKEERSKHQLSQDDLIKAAKLDWSRQTLGQVENGERELKAWEIAKVAQALKVTLASLLETAPVDEPRILWREQPDNHKRREAEFIQKCKEYLFIEKQVGFADGYTALPRYQIDLNKMNFDDVDFIAQRLRQDLRLGDYPASLLVSVLEEVYGVKFVFHSLGGKGAAACTYFDNRPFVLVSKSDVIWRQNFSIAHDLFHLVTWSDSLFDQILKDTVLAEKNEQFANRFAAALLIPSEILSQEVHRLNRVGKLTEYGLVAIAQKFGVSLDALLWRMVRQNLITTSVREKILGQENVRIAEKKRARYPESKDYFRTSRLVRLAYIAYCGGEISAAKFSKILSVNIADLGLTLEHYGLPELMITHEVENRSP